MTKSIYAKLSAKIGQEQKKIAERAERGGKTFEPRQEYFKPKTGENMIRLLPNVNNPENTFVTVKLHYIPGVTKDGKKYVAPIRCLEDYEDSERCPVCKEYKRLMDEGDKETAKAYRAKETILYSILDYGTKKVLPYAMPMKAHETIMSYFEDFRDSMFDLDEGRDWKLTKKVDLAKGIQFGTEYTVRPVMKESSVPEKLRAEVTDAKDLSEIYPESGKAEAKKSMLKMLDLGSDEEEEDEPVKKPSKPSPAKNKYEDEEDEEYVKQPVKVAKPAKKVVVEEEEEEEPAPKKKAKVVVSDDLEDEINALLEDDE